MIFIYIQFDFICFRKWNVKRAGPIPANSEYCKDHEKSDSKQLTRKDCKGCARMCSGKIFFMFLLKFLIISVSSIRNVFLSSFLSSPARLAKDAQMRKEKQ